MQRLALALAIVLLGMTAAPLAHAQLGPNVPAPLTEDPAPPPAAPQDLDDDGFSSLQQLLIFGTAALVLAGIAFFIMRDARKAAPPDRSPRGAGSGSTARSGDAGPGAGSSAAKAARERERAQRAKRQKAKAARRQRKRNRPG